MSRRPSLTLSLLLLAGFVGLVLVALAFFLVEPQPPAAPTRENSTVSTTPSSPEETPSATTGATPVDGATLPPSTSPTPTLVPSRTPTPSPTPTPTPTPSLLSPPRVSSTGWMAYVDGGRLTVLDPDGSEQVIVEDYVAHSKRSVTWSPDGRRLLYVTEVREEEDNPQSRHRTYHVWNSGTGETLDVSLEMSGHPPEGDSLFDYKWSPGGTRILFRVTSGASPQGVWVLDLEATRMWEITSQPALAATWADEDQVLCTPGEEDKPLPSLLISIGPPSQTHTETVRLSSPWSFSPDRRHIAQFRTDAANKQYLEVIALPGHEPLALSAQPTITGAVEAPLWSPDGRWIAYNAEGVGPTGNQDAYTVVVDTTGMNDTRTITPLFAQAWSPDSRLLAGPVCSDDGCPLGVADLWSGLLRVPADAGAMSPDNSDRNAGRLWDLAWSPQGGYLAYSQTRGDPDLQGLMLWDRATGEHRALLSGDEGNSFTDLQWTPDGCRLYAAQRKGRDDETQEVKVVWSIGPGWGDRWQVAQAPGSTDLPLASEAETELEKRPPPCPAPPLLGRRLIAYYGTPLGPGLGILGRNGVTATLTLLQEQAQVYRNLDPDVDTTPVFHMVTTIADDFAGPDGDYNHRVSHEIIRRWIDGLEAVGGWAVLDLQPGHGHPEEEVALIEAFLREPNVHLAVDPEFIMRPGEVPGTDLGRITGPQVNRVQARLDRIGRALGQRKILIVHQFEDRMIEQKEAILDYPFVELIWDADGFGTPGAKIRDYEQYRSEAGFEYGGFKLFYEYDEPLMTEEDVLDLEPPPALVIYQ